MYVRQGTATEVHPPDEGKLMAMVSKEGILFSATGI